MTEQCWVGFHSSHPSDLSSEALCSPGPLLPYATLGTCSTCASYNPLLAQSVHRAVMCAYKMWLT